MTRNRRFSSHATVMTLSVIALTLVWVPRAAAQFPTGAQYQQNNAPCSIRGAGKGTASSSACVVVNLKPTVQVRNLPSQVRKAEVWCATKVGEPDTWATADPIVLSVQYGTAATPSGSGILAAIGIQKSAVPSAQPLVVICELVLEGPLSVKRLAVATGDPSAPQVVSDANWHIVDAGSTVKWTQAITFPSTTP